MAFTGRIMFLLCNTCIRCKIFLDNHFSMLIPSEWTMTMSSNISNNKKRNDHSFTSTIPNSTFGRMHLPSLSLLGINTSNHIVDPFDVLQRMQCFLTFFLSTFTSWFHHPPVLTRFSCHDLRMKANHVPLAQAWTFWNPMTSCHKKHH